MGRKTEVRAVRAGHPSSPQTAMSVSVTDDFLPPAAELEKLEKLHPGITKELVSAFTGQMNHRQDLEKTVIYSDTKRANRGQVLSFLSILFFGGMGTFLIYSGSTIEGMISLVGVLGFHFGAYIFGSITRSLERRQKQT